MNVKTVERVGDVFGEHRIRLFNRQGSALTQGQVAVMDEARQEAETTNANPGDTASHWANGILPNTAAETRQISALYIKPLDGAVGDTLADNKQGIFLLSGIGKARVPNGAALGNALSIDNANPGDLKVAAAGELVVAKCIEANSSGVTAVRDVLFCGYSIFGWNPATS